MEESEIEYPLWLSMCKRQAGGIQGMNRKHTVHAYMKEKDRHDGNII